MIKCFNDACAEEFIIKMNVGRCFYTCRFPYTMTATEVHDKFVALMQQMTLHPIGYRCCEANSTTENMFFELKEAVLHAERQSRERSLAQTAAEGSVFV